MSRFISTSKLILMMLLFGGGLLLHSSVHAKSLTLSRTPQGETFTCAKIALNAAYASLNYEVEYLTLPNKRGLRMSNSGELDGEMLRVDDLTKTFPNLLQVPVSICKIESLLIANEKVQAKKFSDLRRYRFGITIGYVDQERLVKKYKLNATPVMKNDVLVDMLTKDRVDVIFLTRKDAMEVMQYSKKIKLKILDGFSRDIHLYHYLHKKHEKLLPLITQALKTLRDDGKLQLDNRVVKPRF